MPLPLTALLIRLNEGDKEASDSLLPLVYDELRAIARRVMSGQPTGQTMQATVLVHELYLKLAKREGNHSAWSDRRHFFGVAAKAMRNLLADHVRNHRAAKRNAGPRRRVTLSEVASNKDTDYDLVELHDALEELERAHPRVGRAVELRFLAGLTLNEVAAELEIDVRTARRDWNAGQAFLRSCLTKDEES